MNDVRCPIAIVGMGAIFPQARNLKEFWDVILDKKDCITDITNTYVGIEDIFDPRPFVKDKSYCKRAALLPSVNFDLIEFGIPPIMAEAVSVTQLLSLMVARDTLIDAGYHGENTRPFNNEKTSVFMGATLGSPAFPLFIRSNHQQFSKILKTCGIADESVEKIIRKLLNVFDDWQESSFPGFLSNVVTGRIANRFNLYGSNCTVDAACASSLSAIKIAMDELRLGYCDMALAGGVNYDISSFSFMCFCNTYALSPKNQSRPFDAEADGMLLGDGVGMVLLKRLEDAERDGDKIYAVIRELGSSSDGRAKSIYAPRIEGQILSLKRAYEDGGISPDTIGLIEGHGTGTVAGDESEIQSLKAVYNEYEIPTQSIALGSIKSQIGHTRLAAGVASLIKTSLALYHKIKPPMININTPNPKFDLEHSPFYLISESEPWFNGHQDHKRSAAVSAFGFGGTNYHAVLEEYERDHNKPYRMHCVPDIVIIHEQSPENLIQKCESLIKEFEGDSGLQKYDNFLSAMGTDIIPAESPRLGFVSQSLSETCELLKEGIGQLKKSMTNDWQLPRGIFYRQCSVDFKGRIVALFPGQGSQYYGMGKKLCLNYPEMRYSFSKMDALLKEKNMELITNIVYPKGRLPKEPLKQNDLLPSIKPATPAIGAISYGMYMLLKNLGFVPDYIVGHSYGELTALCAAGILSEDAYYELTIELVMAMGNYSNSEDDTGAMISIPLADEQVHSILQRYPGVSIANYNSKDQIVVAGSKDDINNISNELKQNKVNATILNAAAAFHSKFVDHEQIVFGEAVKRQTFKKAAIPVYSNISGDLYSDSSAIIQQTLLKHVSSPVLFRQSIESVYEKGATIFVEFGPRKVLTSFVDNILQNKYHIAIAINPSSDKDDEIQLRQAILQLKILGVPLKNDLYSAHHTKTAIADDVNQKGLKIIFDAPSYYSDAKKKKIQDTLMEKIEIKLKSSPQKTTSPGNTVSSISNIRKGDPEMKKNMADNISDLSKIAPHTPDLQSSSDHFADPISLLLLNQNNLSHVQRQFIQNQSQYLDLVKHVVDSQVTMMDKYDVHPNVQAVLTSLQTTQEHIQKNQEDFFSVHVDFLNSQTSLLTRSISGQNNIDSTSIVHDSQNESLQSFDNPSVPSVIHVDREIITSKLLEIASEKTGYPRDMLDINMNIEGDLGIDSIKRVEIFATLGQQMPELFTKIDTAILGQLMSFRDVIDYLLAQTQAGTQIQADSGTATISPVSPISTAISYDLIVDTLLEIASEKTGYPRDMLDINMNIEGDLGIDSIKRVEIFATLGQQMPELFTKIDTAILGQLMSFRDIVDYLFAQIQTGTQIQADSGTATMSPISPIPTKTSSPVNQDNAPSISEATPINPYTVTTTPQSNRESTLTTANEMLAKDDIKNDELTQTAGNNIKRFIVIQKQLPQPIVSPNISFPAGHTLLILNDGSQLATDCIHALVEKGYAIAVISPPAVAQPDSTIIDKVKHVEIETYSEESIQSSIIALKNAGLIIGGLLSFIPRFEYSSVMDVFKEEEEKYTKMIFSLAKDLQKDIVTASEKGKALFIIITRLDGEFGTGNQSPTNVISGGLNGLVKSLQIEWQHVFCKAIDIDPAIEYATTLQHILEELHEEEYRAVEVGYSKIKGRLTLTLQAHDITSDELNKQHIDSSSIFLVSGGGRGITAECIIGLAVRYKCKFIILGRTSITEPEPEWLVDINDENGLKKAIMKHLKSNKKKVRPVEVNNMLGPIKAKRDILATIESIKTNGGDAIYINVDVTDTSTLKQALKGAVDKFGNIRGIIHGAGNVADKPIEKKTAKDYAAVYDSKIKGLYSMLQCVSPEQLNYLILFSSIAAFFGSPTQTDYSIANEALNKFAYLYKQKYPHSNVLSINWGPWDKGMVTPDIKRRMELINIEIIPTTVGVKYFVKEVCCSDPERLQIIINGEHFKQGIN